MYKKETPGRVRDIRFSFKMFTKPFQREPDYSPDPPKEKNVKYSTKKKTNLLEIFSKNRQ